MRARRRQAAQTATEYMMVISVIVIALTFVVYTPVQNAVTEGATQFKRDQTEASRNGYVGTGYNGERR